MISYASWCALRRRRTLDRLPPLAARAFPFVALSIEVGYIYFTHTHALPKAKNAAQTSLKPDPIAQNLLILKDNLVLLIPCVRTPRERERSRDDGGWIGEGAQGVSVDGFERVALGVSG